MLLETNLKELFRFSKKISNLAYIISEDF